MYWIGRTIERLISSVTRMLRSTPAAPPNARICWLSFALSASVIPIAAVCPSTKADSVARFALTFWKSSSVPPSIMVAIGASVAPMSSVSLAAAEYFCQ